MKILVAGCSFAQHLSSYLQQKIPGSRVTNLALAAAGNCYISDAVLFATFKEKFDLIYISWSGWSRVDLMVEDVSFFKDWNYKGTIGNINYIFSGGAGGWDHHKDPFINMLFTNYYKFTDHEQLHRRSLIEMIKMQSHLSNLNTPFYFTSMIDQFNGNAESMIENTCEYGASKYANNKPLIDKIDFDRWLNYGVYETVKDVGMLDTDNFHPSPQGYNYWTGLFVDRLKKDKIL